ncbi:VRR-NUC domain-containing protein [Flammeovirgaceae bacterium SG7u.111]|nr:VRR-NUC domain-containing protein [Flammeovirgaceae bacterium SG7u.132]WPO36731.1 VRR-NUC domain-containing protein [Flammeovirgaceae bacterium SG7u.111]
MAEIELPPKYYLTYYEEMLCFLEAKCPELLSEGEQYFIQSFRNLPEDARCLFLRMLNRRGRFFRIKKFSYPEIENIPAKLELLLSQSFALPLENTPPELSMEVFEVFSKAELLAFPEVKALDTKGIKQLKKPDLVSLLAEKTDITTLFPRLGKEELMVMQGFEEETEMLRFLYFGNLYTDMTRFVVRDIGHVKFEYFDESQMSAYFGSRKEAEEKLALTKLYQYFREMREEVEPEELYAELDAWLLNLQELTEPAQRVLDRLVLKMGRFFERQTMPQQALRIYQTTDKPPSRERQARLLHATGETEAALKLCQTMMQDANNADERYFAIDFSNRIQKKKRLKSTTIFQKEADKISIPISFQYQVEIGVLDYFYTQEKEGAWVENILWRGLFGMLFWDVIFKGDPETIHNPFQRGPSDLRKPEFFAKRESQLHKQLKILDKPKRLKEYLDKTFEEKNGIMNPFVHWFDELPTLLDTLTSKVPADPLKKVMLEIAHNPSEHTKGFPDLFVWDAAGYEFIEVKSPTDSLSPQQLQWLEFFGEVGINAKVLNVEWLPEE